MIKIAGEIAIVFFGFMLLTHLFIVLGCKLIHLDDIHPVVFLFDVIVGVLGLIVVKGIQDDN